MKSLLTNPKHLRRALTQIGSRARGSDLRLEIGICHGHCLIAASRASGRPIPIAMPNGLARSLVADVADSMRLPRPGLDNDLSDYVVQLAASGKLVQEARDTGVQLSINETARLLAHKLSVLETITPPRDTDDADAVIILRGMREVTEAQVEAIFARYCPDSLIGPLARELIARETAASRVRS